MQPRDAKPKRRRRNKGMGLEDRPVLEPNAAGIDVGAGEMLVAVPPGRDENPVRGLATFPEDLERLSDGLEQCGVTTVALESTGGYWIPRFEILEPRGIPPCLVNARPRKNVPGRRTDWHECQWLQFLHSVGSLRAAFRPGPDICAVRTLLRHRNELVAAASQPVQHMHKALTQMNLQIHHVIRDITGLTGRAMVNAILAGERDGAELAQLRDPHIKAHADTMRKSPQGNWFPHPRLSNRTGGVTASGSRKRLTMVCVTPSATPEHTSGWLDLSSIPMLLRRFLRPSLTEVPSLHRSCPASSVLRTSPPPHTAGLALASCRLIPLVITAGASRVASGPLCLHAVATTPAGPRAQIARY